MKAIVTGMNGTVAPVLGQALEARGYRVVAWDREIVPADDEEAGRHFVDEEQPDAFFHVATGSPLWAEHVARLCAERAIPFLFTSTVSVFGPEQQFPLTPDVPPQATDDYGTYKQECERLVRAANPDTIIARLGWQIGQAPGSNNMVDYLQRTAEREGTIAANVNWVPSCAFLEDTADGLYRLLRDYPAGLYHLEGNPGLSFFEIASGLNRVQQRGWAITAVDEPPFDNRMRDERIDLAPITGRLGGGVDF